VKRFPRVGDYVRFKSYYSANIRDLFAGNNIFVTFNVGDLYQILGIQIHNYQVTAGCSYDVIDAIPFSLFIEIHDKLSKPAVIELNIDTNILEFIPGDNPKAVETLYGR
jgi:hypothetical protein